MIDAHTLLYGIFGSPVRHSLSPLMHNRAFQITGINAAYLAFEPLSIKDAVASMRTLGISGASVTIPFKIEIIPFLDKTDLLAEQIGSVNTLINRDGIIHGYNTDGYGAVLALQKRGHEIKNEKILIIGNGGSARAIAFSILLEGGNVTIAGRNEKKISSLVSDLSVFYANTSGAVIADLDQKSIKAFDIIINTTPLGMHPDVDTLPIDTSLLDSGQTVFDIVYSPYETRLLREAGERGCQTVYGIDMLLYQGVRQFEIWTSKDAPVDDMREVLINHAG